MLDRGQRATEQAQAAVARRLKRIYGDAVRDIDKQLKTYTEQYAKADAQMRQKVEEGTMTEAQYKSWVRGQAFATDQWRKKRDMLTNTMYDADVAAQKIINGQRLNVFADNANSMAYEMEHGEGVDFGFGYYDSATVARLLKDEPDLLPASRVKKDADTAWYRQKVNNCITKGIITGSSIQDIARELARETGEMAYKAALRNARTAMTGAQNAGRIEAMQEAQRMGIRVQKRWMSTLDGRTRDAHRDLDGQVQDVDKPFDSDLGAIMFPGDPSAAPGNVYNCRCTLTYVHPEYPSDLPRLDRTTGEVIADMTYRDWEKSKRIVPSFNEWSRSKPESKFAKDMQTSENIKLILDAFGIENPIKSKREIVEYFQYVDQTGGIWKSVDSIGRPVDKFTEEARVSLDMLTDNLLRRIYNRDEEISKQFEAAKKYLKGHPLYISAYDRSSIPDFDDYRKSKANYVRTSYNVNATSLDGAYEELIKLFPGRFDPDALDVPEKLLAINRGMASMEMERNIPVIENMSFEDVGMMSKDLRDFLISAYEAAGSV